MKDEHIIIQRNNNYIYKIDFNIVENFFESINCFFDNLEWKKAFNAFKPPEDRRYAFWYYKTRF